MEINGYKPESFFDGLKLPDGLKITGDLCGKCGSTLYVVDGLATCPECDIRAIDKNNEFKIRQHGEWLKEEREREKIRQENEQLDKERRNKK